MFNDLLRRGAPVRHLRRGDQRGGCPGGGDGAQEHPAAPGTCARAARIAFEVSDEAAALVPGGLPEGVVQDDVNRESQVDVDE